MLGNWVFSSFRNSALRCSRVYVFGCTYVYFIRYISVSGGDKSLHKLSFSFPQWLYQFTLPQAFKRDVIKIEMILSPSFAPLSYGSIPRELR